MWRDTATAKSGAKSRDATANLVSLSKVHRRGDPREYRVAESEEIVARPTSGIAGIPSQHEPAYPLLFSTNGGASVKGLKQWAICLIGIGLLLS